MADEQTTQPTDTSQIPEDRVFGHVRFFLTEDNRPSAEVLFDGKVLKALGADGILSRESYEIVEATKRAIEREIEVCGMTAQVMRALTKVLNLDEEEASGDENTTDDSPSI